MEGSNFTWQLKDRSYSLEEMDLEFRLAALIHCLNIMNKHTKKYEENKRKANELKESITRQQVELTKQIKEFDKIYDITIERIKHYNSQAKESINEADHIGEKYDVLTRSIAKEYNIDTPEDIQDLRALKQLVKSGVIKPHQPELI